MSSPVKRPLPLLTDSNRFFWTSGADGRLRFLRCSACSNYVHPPVPVCDKCLSMALEVVPVSGRATLAAVTVNHQLWIPTMEPPYVVGIVEIAEQPSVRLTTNIVKCAEADLRIGMPLEVEFEECEDVFLPLFRPLDAAPDAAVGER
ncbi:MAG: OB-fold domain-containing protein [Halioglobus sp.]